MQAAVPPVRWRGKAATVIEAVCAVTGVTPSELKGDSCRKRVAWPRQLAMYLTVMDAGRSRSETGMRFGGRHHTTVIHAIAAVEARMAAGCVWTGSALQAVRDRLSTGAMTQVPRPCAPRTKQPAGSHPAPRSGSAERAAFFGGAQC